MNTWQALKKIVRDQFTRPVPEPWNGKHELAYIKYVEHFGRMPDDYTTGYMYKCTCGATNYISIFGLVDREVDAAEKFWEHYYVYNEPLTPARQESCPTRLMDGRNEIRCWLTAGHEGDCK